MMKTTISFLKSKYSRKETFRQIDELEANYLHVDVMDGKFVENANFKAEELHDILKDVKKEISGGCKEPTNNNFIY